MTNRQISAKAIFLIFVLCAVCDFVWGYVHERSIPAGVLSVIGGLFGTAFYLLVTYPWKDDTKSDDSRRSNSGDL